MTYIRDDEEDELVDDADAVGDDETASLDDDLLSEVIEEEVIGEEDMEGFGLLEEAEVAPVVEEESEDAEGDVSLEDDAEDVDYDSFDDVDEM